MRLHLRRVMEGLGEYIPVLTDPKWQGLSDGIEFFVDFRKKNRGIFCFSLAFEIDIYLNCLVLLSR